ncbi:Hypothetical protein PHPALM_9004 [Phytophthora palmivora]|uniref:Uncharacterized protein n=1 Tax=Phytophthora palmivora TaxID=4796 RepID=A0A2P4Y8E3_9STRA|nr:Hypothetical protein PHPALM_9004 [Phytophthora palmivora]
MVKSNSLAFAGLKFNGTTSDFQRWEDAVVAHLTSLTNHCRVARLKSAGNRPVSAPGPDATAEDLTQYELEMAFLVEQESYLRDNQTLPHGYMTQLSTSLASQPISAFWQQLEADFDQNNTLWMVEIIQEFDAALAMDFSSVAPADSAEPFESPRSRDVGGAPYPKKILIGKVLSLLPSHLWGPSVAFTPEEFTLEKQKQGGDTVNGKMAVPSNPVPMSVQTNLAAKGYAAEKKGQSKRLGKHKEVPLPMDDE